MIPHFHGILTGKFIYGIMFVIQGNLQGQKVNLMVKFLKILFLTNTNSSKSDFQYEKENSKIKIKDISSPRS